MEIITTNNHCIITPMSPKLDKTETKRLIEEIETVENESIGIDLTFVKDCTIEFLEEIKKIGKVSLFNIQSDIFAVISAMNLDKSINIYVSENDFLENKRRILNRHLTVIN